MVDSACARSAANLRLESHFLELQPGVHSLRFSTEYRYTDRHTKGEYVWRKYTEILHGASILDVGGDESPLKQHLDETASCWSIGLGGSPDQTCDLEAAALPYDDASYDCVLCLDVLEHLECIHAMFLELCRVARRHVIISLPNPWDSFWSMVRRTDWRPGQPLKFYGLPAERPEDRHRWFFSNREARRFIESNADECGMRVVQMDNEGGSGHLNLLERMAMKVLFRGDLDLESLNSGPLWVVLEHPSDR